MADVPVFNLTSKNDNQRNQALNELNTYLSTRSFLEGWSLSSLDLETYLMIPANVDAGRYVHIARWQAHVASFTRATQDSWRVVERPVPEEPEKADEEGDEEEDDEEGDDPFGLDDSDDDEETRKMMREKADKIRAIQERQAAKKGKAKSNLTIDVKPEDAETDMDEVTEAVKAIEMDGLKWLGGQLIDVAYGIQKLRIMCQITDEKIPSADIIVEAAEEVGGVQSVDIFAFQMA